MIVGASSWRASAETRMKPTMPFSVEIEVDYPGIGSVLEDGVEIMCDFCSLNQRGPITCYASLPLVTQMLRKNIH